MAKATPLIAAFNAGEWTPKLDGRTDLQGYTASCSTLQNVIPSVQGPAIRRPGTVYAREVKDSADRTWLMPFRRSRATAYQIEFGDQYCRFYFNRALVLTGVTATINAVSNANPGVVTTAAAHGYANGQDVYITGCGGMTEVNGRWFKCANVTGTTFELTDMFGNNVDATNYGTYTSGGTSDKPYELASPYALADLTDSDGMFALDFVQSGDVLYITDRGGSYAPRKLTRTSSTSWGFTTLDPDTGPFADLNTATTTMYASAATGSITITASASVFTANHVGALIRIDQEVITSTAPWETSKAYTSGDYVRSVGKEYKAANSATSGTSIPAHTGGTVSDGGVNWEYISPGYGIARITAQAGTTATATVLTTFPQTLVGSGNASTLWRFGAWSAVEGYPEVVTFFKERLVFAKGQRVDMSRSASFEDFSLDSFGEILKTDAISLTVQSPTTDDIVGLTPGENVLTIHTEGGEHIMSSLTVSEAFGPGNVDVNIATTYGARPIPPIRVGEAVVYVQASGRKVREQTFDLSVETYVARDLTLRSEHLTKAGKRFIGMVRAEEPHQLMWLWRDDGILIAFTYDRTQEVRGWAPQVIGGDGVVESCSVIPSPDGGRDDLWLIVRRTVNGATKRYVEYLSDEHETGDDIGDAIYMDSAATYDGSAATTIRGADHLAGVSVTILADGAAHPSKAVADGTVTLDLSSSVVQLGFPTVMKLATHRTDAGARDGTSQTKTKRITDVAFRVLDTLGGTTGPDFTTLDEIPDLTYREPATLMGTGESLVTGDVQVGSWPGGYETDGRICYYNDTQFPATIIAIAPQVVTEESR